MLILIQKDLPNFAPPVWKLHNPYCHTVHENNTRYVALWFEVVQLLLHITSNSTPSFILHEARSIYIELFHPFLQRSLPKSYMYLLGYSYFINCKIGLDKELRGCNSVVECPLRMRKAPGSNPGTSNESFTFCITMYYSMDCIFSLLIEKNSDIVKISFSKSAKIFDNVVKSDNGTVWRCTLFCSLLRQERSKRRVLHF